MKNAHALTNTRQSLPVSPIKHYQELQPVTLTDVFQSGTPAISVVKKEHGKQTAAAYVVAMLRDIQEFYNVKQSLTEVQMKMIAEMVMKSFYYLKVADLKLFSEKFKLGLYGKVYDRIDGGVIMDAIGQYADERMNEAEGYSQKQASQFKHAGEQAATNILRAIADKWKDARPEQKPKPVFRSVVQYCQYYGLDEKDIGRKLAQAVSEDYDRAALDMDYDQYTHYWMNQWLFDKTIEARNR